MPAGVAAPEPATRIASNVPVDAEFIRAGIDLEQWARLRDRWAATSTGEYNPAYGKYFDIDRWLPPALKAARRTGLDEGGRKRVLDIGCGSGLFGHVCQRLGHEFVGLDIGNPMFRDMCDVLGVRFVTHVIERRVPLPEDLTGFDVVTAISTKFDRSETIAGRLRSYAWDADDWAFFLADVRSRLAPGGLFLVRRNMHKPTQAGLRTIQEPPQAGLRTMLERGRQLDVSTFVLTRDQLPAGPPPFDSVLDSAAGAARHSRGPSPDG